MKKVKDLDPVQKEYYKILSAWKKLNLMLEDREDEDNPLHKIIHELLNGVIMIDNELNKE